MPNLRDNINQLFDYRGDVAKNGDSTNLNSYHKDYSPNNIRRVLISPNGVLVQLHHGVEGYGKKSHSTVFDYLEFNENLLYQAENMPDYKPILHALSKPVCSSIEEILIFNQSASGTINAGYQKEVQIDVLIKGYNGVGNVTERIQNRFRRLRYFTIVNMSFPMFIQGLRSAPKMLQEEFLTENSVLKKFIQSTVELASADEYWKYNGNQSTYVFDSEVLKPHFDKIRAKKESELKSLKIAEFKAKNDAEASKSLAKLYSEYNSLFELQAKFMNVVAKCGTNGLIGVDIKPMSFSKLKKHEGMPKINPRLLETGDFSSKEAIDYNKKIIDGAKKASAEFYATNLIEALASLAVEPSKITINILLHEAETSVIVPSGAIGGMSKITSLTGFKFDGQKLGTSIINSLWLYCRFFLDRNSETYNPEVVTREYWEKEVKL